MNKEKFNESVLRSQYVIHGTSRDVEKKSARSKINDEVEAWLASGGKVKELDGYVQKDTPEHKGTEKIKPWRNAYGIPRFFNHTANTKLREWCKARKNRALDLANLMNVSENFISNRVRGHVCVSVESFKFEFEPVMKRIEDGENGQEE